jgi:hypothetical protein
MPILVQCDACHFVVEWEHKCSSCGGPSPCRLFPSIYAGHLHEIISDFLSRAVQEQAISFSEGCEKAAKILERPVSEGQLKELRSYLEREAKNFFGRGHQFSALEAAKRQLQIDNKQKILDVLAVCFDLGDGSEYSAVAVVLSVTLLERLLNDLLSTMLQVMGRNIRSAELSERVQSFDRKRDLFKLLVGSSLQTVIEPLDSKFFDEWNSVSQKRHLYIHGQPYAIGEQHVTTATRLCDVAFDVCGKLQNKALAAMRVRSVNPDDLKSYLG